MSATSIESPETDVLLALLASVLPEDQPVPPQDVLLQALADELASLVVLQPKLSFDRGTGHASTLELGARTTYKFTQTSPLADATS